MRASGLLFVRWWLTAAAVGCLVLSLTSIVTQTVFLQKSAHRLAWWRDRRRHWWSKERAVSRPTGSDPAALPALSAMTRAGGAGTLC
ncbi:hypothetical protein [Streptomyces werraensis]|uniref:hypothetical protein n=1 Tax=Streptomyces werraensis TaxID=68284 RepID=UPI0033BE88BB